MYKKITFLENVKKSKIYQLEMADFLGKNEASGKIDNFAFKNSNNIIEGIIWKRKDYFL